jgi:hypothetical protein
MTKQTAAYDPVVLWCRASRLPEPVPEFKFCETRKWRLDWAWPEPITTTLHDGVIRLALEQEGGVFLSGRHVRGAGYREDLVKYAEAAILGWTVLRATPEQIQNGTAFDWLTRIFHGRS